MSSTRNPAPNDSFRPVLGAAVGLFVALLGIASLKSYRDLEAAHARERLLETRIEETTARIERLRGRIDRLRTDPGTLERLAREDLGMVRPGDVIIELPVEVPGSRMPDAPIREAGSAAPPASPVPAPAPTPAPAAGPPAPGSP